MSEGLMMGAGTLSTNVTPINVRSADDLFREEDARRRRDADEAQSDRVVSSLGSFVRACWEDASEYKRNNVEPALRGALHQRQGKYAEDKLQAIRKHGGTEIYMMLTSVKCRAAAAWLRDALLGTGVDKPWSIQPTPKATLTPQDEQMLVEAVRSKAVELMHITGQAMSEADVDKLAQVMSAQAQRDVQENARKGAQATEALIEDVLVEGGFLEAFDAFIDDLVTFETAFMKGPVVHKRTVNEWQEAPDGRWVAVPVEKKVERFERVSPFDMYPAPGISTIDEGYMIQHHRLTRQALSQMRGVPGYSDDAIDAALEDYGRGGLKDWMAVDPNTGERNPSSETANEASVLIDAVEFWGSVPGRLLVEWGMPRSAVPDLNAEYQANVWLVGDWVIKSVLNHDPYGEKPYYKTSYESVPGAFWGHGVPSLIRDVQDVCNAASRALVNNMGIASGPQVWLNTDRMPPGEKISQMYPWKVWQVLGDPMGASSPPMGFFQPNSLSNELLQVFEHFSRLADDYSGIPRYMTGNENVGGAGRTASGMSMMMGNASKLIKQVVNNIDRVIEKLVTRTHRHLLITRQDPEVRGDVNIVARGAATVMHKDMLQVRRNEFLATTANPIDAQIVGVKGRAALLRESARLLGMNTDDVVPDPEFAQYEQAAMAAMQAQMGGAQQGAPQANESPGVNKQNGRPAAALMDPTSPKGQP